MLFSVLASKTYKGKGAFRAISASHRKLVNSLKQLDINPREYLFEKVFAIFSFKEFSTDVVDNIAQTKKEYDGAIASLVKTLVSDLKILFTPKGQDVRGSLTSIIQDWYSSLKDTTIQHLFANSENQILDLMRTITNDETTFTQRLAKAVTALRVEDWNERTISTFIKDLTIFKETIEEYDSQIIDETAAADTYKLITTDSEGREVVKTFNRSEYSSRANRGFIR